MKNRIDKALDELARNCIDLMELIADKVLEKNKRISELESQLAEREERILDLRFIEKELTDFNISLKLAIAEREWVSVEDRLPEEGEIVFIYCSTHPEKFDHDYSALKDGSDRTKEALIDREWARKWFAEYPIKQGSLYMTAISGLRWRMRGCAPDSRYSFFGDEGIVTHWMPLPQSPKGE